MKNPAPIGGAKGGQDINTVGTGTDLTALPQRDVAPSVIEGQQYDQALSLKLVGNLTKNDTTPDVNNNEHWIANNTAPVSVTDFDGGQDGHHIYILGDGFTTTVHNANIINVAGVNLLLDSGVIFHYVNVHGVWYQICCTDGGGGGGSVAWVDITGKPSVFPPDYVGFPPAWTDISGKPATFPPDYVSFPPDWSFITGKPAVFPPDYVTFPPAWGDLTGVPAVFPPDMSGVVLNDLANVDTTGQVATMFLRYDGAQWIAESVAVGSSTLAGLSDVAIAAPANGNILVYNSGTSKWVNQAPAASGDVFLAANNTFTGDNQMPGIRLQSVFPAITYRDTDLAVNAAGLWYVTCANGSLQVLKNTAAAGDFSTYQSVLVSGGTSLATSATSFVLDTGVAANAAIQVDATYTILFGPHATTPCHIYVGSNADSAIYMDADNHWFRTQTGTVSARLQRSGTTVNFFHLGTTGNCGTTGDPWDTVQVILNGGYYVNAIKVVGNRVTGWNAPTGTATRGTFAVVGATAATCAQAICALITDLRAHGLINT
jgi:hypothetical protein